jgi:methylamine---glutamate N-methyltransferase subunit A
LCGIAGIVYLDPARYASLGSDLLSLIQPLESRGPDSCGVALYGNEAAPEQVKLLLRGEAQWSQVQTWLSQFAEVVETEAIADGQRFLLKFDADRAFSLQQLKQSLSQTFPALHLSSIGRKLEIYKGVGAVENLSQQYGLATFSGTHGIAHTRMATESVVDTDHSHPFSTSYDLSIVHNGQISNYYKLRFQLERVGMVFETDNDSEAIAHYIYYQFLQGESLETALEKLLRDIDGTYTFLVATPDKLGLVRDKFAAKPAVIYESAEMVAIASEYRALLTLPQFDPTATIREPDASEVNVWSVSAGTRELQLTV